MSDDLAIVVFAREPKLGRVKTRLQKSLPAKIVLNLYKAFVKDVICVVNKLNDAQLFLYYYGVGSSIPFLRFEGAKFTLKRQLAGDLGVKMGKAFKDCFLKKISKVLIIGTDCVTINETDLKNAAKKLGKHDCVLGPSKDGGYYLIGLKDFDACYFNGVTWGTEEVLDQTVKNITKCGKSIAFLRVRDDIDTIADLNSFRNIKIKDNTALNTRKALKALKI